MNQLITLIEESAIATSVREGDLLFPLIETLHILAVSLVFGSIMVVDLRLLGAASRARPVSRLTASILPVTWVAFVVAIGAGGLMFISKAHKYLENGYFDAKLVLIAAAGLNMMVFHLLTARDIATWDTGAPPLGARIAGGLSMALWISVITCGRLIGFTMPVG